MQPKSASAIFASLLQDLRVPSIALPVRYFLESEKGHPQAKSSRKFTSHMRQKGSDWVIAVPDTRGLQRSKSSVPNTLATMRKQASKSSSLRHLVQIMEYGVKSAIQDPIFVAAAFSSIDRLLRAAETSQHPCYPHHLSSMLPHLSIAEQWEGQEPYGVQSSSSTRLLKETGLLVAKQYLLPSLSSHDVLEQLDMCQMADIAAALSILQPQSSSCLAPSFWEHLKGFTEDPHTQNSPISAETMGMFPHKCHTRSLTLYMITALKMLVQCTGCRRKHYGRFQGLVAYIAYVQGMNCKF